MQKCGKSQIILHEASCLTRLQDCANEESQQTASRTLIINRACCAPYPGEAREAFMPKFVIRER